MEEAEAISDEVMFLFDGRIVADGKPEQLKQEVQCGFKLKVREAWTPEDACETHAYGDVVPAYYDSLEKAAEQARRALEKGLPATVSPGGAWGSEGEAGPEEDTGGHVVRSLSHRDIPV